MPGLRLAGVLAALCMLPCPQARAEDALDRIARTGEIRLAVRADAPPFSAIAADGTVQGFSIDLCSAVVAEAALRLIQASGRLLRKESDTGTITILDERLLTRGYGRAILDSLPPYEREVF
jgi:ABC-type amino acid transport substrate-binding protein